MHPRLLAAAADTVIRSRRSRLPPFPPLPANAPSPSDVAPCSRESRCPFLGPPDCGCDFLRATLSWPFCSEDRGKCVIPIFCRWGISTILSHAGYSSIKGGRFLRLNLDNPDRLPVSYVVDVKSRAQDCLCARKENVMIGASRGDANSEALQGCGPSRKITRARNSFRSVCLSRHR